MSEANPVRRVAKKVTETLQGGGSAPADGIPGRPAPEPPAVEEPTEPREPLPPKPDQSAPATVSPTGQPTGADQARMAQSGSHLTNAQGTRLYDTDHSLKAGPRGPVLLQDHHLREKIMHFDHERIPERVVHARGAGAHGVFQSYGTASAVTKAGFLAPDVETPVFVRFSTVVGSRGSADTVRDTRGFATKFYTSEGVFDLVGNNIPVFFIQDAIKFPDVVHAAKPHPDREIPQAQSAHDTFWDFVSLHTEATHHTLFFMGDRGIPRSYRMMEGFGVHTFRLVNAEGGTTLVKFHWKPKLGVHSLVWDEAQLINGNDPDFHRRDLADAIEAGAYPQWELGIQTFPDTPDQTFEGIDLLDPTNIVPEELAPVQPIGLMTLNRNPSNFFAETEQVAFHVGHLVPGIDVTDDPLLAGRLFSYLDTQITRLGGPNFPQLPINRPHAPVNDMLRDGMHQTAVHRGRRALQAQLPRRRLPVHRGRGHERLHRDAGDRPRGAEGARGAGVVRRPLQPAPPVLAQHEPGRARAHHRRVHLRAGQVLRGGDPRADPPGPRQHRPRAVLPGRRGTRHDRAGADGAARRRRAEPGAVADRRDLAGGRPRRRHPRRSGRRPGRGARGA